MQNGRQVLTWRPRVVSPLATWYGLLPDHGHGVVARGAGVEGGSHDPVHPADGRGERDLRVQARSAVVVDRHHRAGLILEPEQRVEGRAVHADDVLLARLQEAHMRV